MILYRLSFKKVDSIKYCFSYLYVSNNNIVYESEECNYDLDKIILETLSDDIDYVYQ